MGIWYGVASEFTWRPFGIMHVESHNNNNSGLSARDDLEARSSGSRGQSRDPVPVTDRGVSDPFWGGNPPSPADAMPDMVIWAVYACMLGRTRRSAAGSPHSHLLNTTTPAVSLKKSMHDHACFTEVRRQESSESVTLRASR